MADPNLPPLVFIIVRHVTSPETDVMWAHAYVSIRKIYPVVPIIIIDDASPYKPSLTAEGKDLVNCTVISSEFPKRGEMLPYYYFHKLKPAFKAVVIHDSVFINKPLDFEHVFTYQFLWHFVNHTWDFDSDVIPMLSACTNSKQLVRLYKTKTAWHGCFGGMSIITWDFLDKIDQTFGFFAALLPQIKCRQTRMHFERIFACACVSLGGHTESVSGDIHQWNRTNKIPWGFSFERYLCDQPRCNSLPLMKVWTGR